MSHPREWPLQQVLPWKPPLCYSWSSSHLSLLQSSAPSLVLHFFHFPQAVLIKRKACSERRDNNTLQLPQTIPEPLRARILPFTPEVALLGPAKPQSPAMTPPPSSAPTASSLLNATIATTLLPWEEVHMQVHTILIVVIFCVVCLLLLLAFFYAFCFHCSIKSSPKDSDNRCSLDREDATYKCSSSDNQSVGNAV